MSKRIDDNSRTTMKSCCGLCPFSKKNTLFLHPDRALDFAISAENPYNDFVCHKTGVVLDNDEQSIVRGEKSLTCAGFHVMQCILNGKEERTEVEIDYEDHFSDTWEMVGHHQSTHE